jgi:hypothetical protein
LLARTLGCQTRGSESFKHAHRTHHGGTSEVYNHDGGVNAERYERIWRVRAPAAGPAGSAVWLAAGQLLGARR